MKKLKLIATCMIASLLLNAQPYGQTQYPGGSVMSSGYRTFINSGNDGFIMAGLKGSDFHIDKTVSGGLVPSYIGGSSFERDYKINENGSCGSANGSPVTPPDGVCAIEIIPTPSGANYVVAGAYSEACFITFLSRDGTAMNTRTYPFPSSASAINRPVIIQDPNTLNMYITGSYNSDMYIIKVNSGGTILWSKFYNAGGSVFMQPRDMIISGFNSDLIVVGHMSPNFSIYGSASDGFFI